MSKINDPFSPIPTKVDLNNLIALKNKLMGIVKLQKEINLELLQAYRSILEKEGKDRKKRIELLEKMYREAPEDLD